jgi:hypothetical protein
MNKALLSINQPPTGQAVTAMLNRVLLANVTLLVAHQIDSAYWHEWEMFGLPGGIQLNVLMNILLVGAVLACAFAVVARHRHAFICSCIVAGVGTLILPIHAAFALAGHQQFHLPVSMAVIVLSFALACWQLVLTRRLRAVLGA